MPDLYEDSVIHPKHYKVYPVQPIQLTRHLGFCLGNAVKYVLRAPYKDGVEDCDKAIQYLEWVKMGGVSPVLISHYALFEKSFRELSEFLANASGDALWDAVAENALSFLENLDAYLQCPLHRYVNAMLANARELSQILSLRDTTGQIYEGMSGLPQEEAMR